MIKPLILQANAVRSSLADQTVQCYVTSPPYFQLRDYSHGGDFWPAGRYQTLGGIVEVPEMRCPLGLEPTPEAYVWHMLLIFREMKRTLLRRASL